MTRSHKDTLILEIGTESIVVNIEVIDLRAANQPTLAQQSRNEMLVTTPLTSAYSSAANSEWLVARDTRDTQRRLRPRRQWLR